MVRRVPLRPRWPKRACREKCASTARFSNTPAALKALTEKVAGRGRELRFFATRPERAAMASNDNSAQLGTNVRWSLHH